MTFDEETVWRTSAAMDKVGRNGLEELEKRLAAGTAGEIDPELAALGPLGAERAAELIEAARPEYERGEYIVGARKELHQRIQGAMGEVARAQEIIRNLWSKWGDVEFEDGHAATGRCLEAALHQLECAQAVKPSGKDGELR